LIGFVNIFWANWFLDKDKKILYQLAQSKNLWERRIAIISTFEFIRHNQFTDALKLSEILISCLTTIPC